MKWGHNMRNKFFIIVFISMFCVASPAYAIIDIVATIQSILETVKEVETKVETITKKIKDGYRRAAEGFQAASSCFSNPKNCGLNALGKLSQNLRRPGAIKGIKFIKGANLDGDLIKKDASEMDKNIIKAYAYTRGTGDDINKAGDKRDQIQGAVADELAVLFAKGMVVQQMIKNEKEEDLYQANISENQSEILSAQNNLALVSQARLSRILELRSYMQGANATLELGRYTITEDEQ